jgi:hypothetical protein
MVVIWQFILNDGQKLTTPFNPKTCKGKTLNLKNIIGIGACKQPN